MGEESSTGFCLYCVRVRVRCFPRLKSEFTCAQERQTRICIKMCIEIRKKPIENNVSVFFTDIIGGETRVVVVVVQGWEWWWWCLAFVVFS